MLFYMIRYLKVIVPILHYRIFLKKVDYTMSAISGLSGLQPTLELMLLGLGLLKRQ